MRYNSIIIYVTSLTKPLYHSPFFFGRWSPSPMNRGGALVTLNFHVNHYVSTM